MFLRVLDMTGVYAGELNLDNVDMIQLIESTDPATNSIKVWGVGSLKDFKLSKSAYAGLQRYLNGNGIV